MLHSDNKYNRVALGMLVSIGTIVVAYAFLKLAAEFAASMELIDDPIGEGYDKMERTLWLIAICANIIGIQVFKKRKWNNLQRGIAIITVVSAFVWFFIFKDSILFIPD